MSPVLDERGREIAPPQTEITPRPAGAWDANADVDKGAARLRGFAALSPERRREIASKGGKSAQAKGWAHRWTKDEAQAAGRKGGSAPPRSRAEAIEAAWQRGADDGANDFTHVLTPDCPFEDGSEPARWWQRGYESRGGAQK